MFAYPAYWVSLCSVVWPLNSEKKYQLNVNFKKIFITGLYLLLEYHCGNKIKISANYIHLSTIISYKKIITKLGKKIPVFNDLDYFRICKTE